MKEAFEKIKEILGEVAEVCESEASKELLQCGHSSYYEFTDGKKEGFFEALSIVSEVEAEYGNGWIPCSERLPEDFQSVLCYAESIARSPDTIFVGSQKHGCWFLQSSIGTESFPTQYEVLAWMPLPEAYKPEKGV